MSLINRILRLARSPQGRRMMSEANRYARSPKGRAQVDRVRNQIVSRRKGPGRPR